MTEQQMKVTYETVNAVDRYSRELVGGAGVWVALSLADWNALPWGAEVTYMADAALDEADRTADVTAQANQFIQWEDTHVQPYRNVQAWTRDLPPPDPAWSLLDTRDRYVAFTYNIQQQTLGVPPTSVVLPTVAAGQLRVILGYGTNFTTLGGIDSTFALPTLAGWTLGLAVSSAAVNPGEPDKWVLSRIKVGGDPDTVSLPLGDHDGQWTGVILAIAFTNIISGTTGTGFLTHDVYPGGLFTFDNTLTVAADSDAFAIIAQESNIVGAPIDPAWSILASEHVTGLDWRLDIITYPKVDRAGASSIDITPSSYTGPGYMRYAAGWAFLLPQIARIPNVPIVPTVDVGNTQLVAHVLEPSDGGSPITSYTWQYSVSPYSSWTTGDSGLSGGAPRGTITGLTNGTPYKIQVSATNALGTSAYSPPSLATVPTV